MNKAIIAGHLAKKPELKFTSTGGAVTNLAIATTDKWTDKQGKSQEKTEWHTVVVFGKQAELCNQYLDKGSQALVEGKIATRSYELKTGEKKYVTEVIADHVQFL